jgi:cellulose biosynthesis protein BcsQ
MAEHIDDGALSRVVAVLNGKGGVLKTSIVANVAGQLARSGMRVLAVDLDVSGNLKLDLGVTAGDDSGKSVVDAVGYGSRLAVAKDVRANLDLVYGGRGLEMLGVLARTPSAVEGLPSGSVGGEFASRIAEVAPDYDLILLDCPPGNAELQDMALAAARWVLVPTKTDQASLDGLLAVGPRVRRARVNNAGLDYLGLVVTAHNPSATRVARNVESMLSAVSGRLPILQSWIRHSETAAHDCRSRGQLAHELAADVVEGRGLRLRALGSRRRSGSGGDVIELPGALSASADSLAGDYQRLAAEICERITAAETGSAADSGPESGPVTVSVVDGVVDGVADGGAEVGAGVGVLA